MTDDLAYRLREMADEYDSGHHESWPTIDAFNQAADRIETLNAMLKAAEESLGDQLAARKEQADRIEAQAAEIERLRMQLKAAALWTAEPGTTIAEIRAALGETK